MSAVEEIMQREIERLREQLHLAEVAGAAQVEGLTQGAAGWRERANQLETEVAKMREYLDASQRRAAALGDEVAGLCEQLRLAEVVRAAQVEGLTTGANILRDDRDALRAEVAGLREFSGKVLGTHREHGCCDIDGSDVQDWAIGAGLLHEVEVTESCGAEDCACMEYYGAITEQFPAKCLRLTDAGQAALAARKGKA